MQINATANTQSFELNDLSAHPPTPTQTATTQSSTNGARPKIQATQTTILENTIPDNPQQTIHARKTQTVTSIPEDCNAEDLGFEIVDAHSTPNPAAAHEKAWDQLEKKAQDIVNTVKLMRQANEKAVKYSDNMATIWYNYNQINLALSSKSPQEKIPALKLPAPRSTTLSPFVAPHHLKAHHPKASNSKPLASLSTVLQIFCTN